MKATQEDCPCVLIASEIRLYREGFAHILRQDGRLHVVELCAEMSQALEAAKSPGLNAVLLDTHMAGALEIIRKFRECSPATAVIALGLNETEEEVLPCVESGVSGYVHREGTVDDVVRAVLCAQNREFVCSRRIAAALQRRIVRLTWDAVDMGRSSILTRRERQVAEFLDAGLSNKEIAGALHITLSTVKNHVHNILEKVRARTRSEAAAKLRNPSRSPPWTSASPPP